MKSGKALFPALSEAAFPTQNLNKVALKIRRRKKS
jgi:hypothetical protein